MVDHRGVDAGAVGDRPDRGAVEPAVGELGPGGGEQGGTGVRAAGAAAPPTSGGGGSGVARASASLALGAAVTGGAMLLGPRVGHGAIAAPGAAETACV